MKRLLPFPIQLLLVLLALHTSISPLRAADATAFELIKEGNRFVSEEAKDKIVEIRSEKSVASLVPNIWYIIYYDAALATAKKEPLLEKLTLTNSQLKLDKDGEGILIWKVRLWAAKIRRPADTTDIGEVIISAETGKVLKTDLHIDRVD